MRSGTLERRHFVQLAAALIAAPFAARTRWASAGGDVDEKPPLRMLTLLDSYGLSDVDRSSIWVDSSVGDYALDESSLGTVLDPLANYRDLMLVVSGISLDSSTETSDGVTHDKLTAQALTGSKGVGSGASTTQAHASLDIHIGEYLSSDYGLSSPRVYPHVFLSDYAEPGKTTFCYDTTGNQRRAISGARNIVNTLFGGGAEAKFSEMDLEAEQQVVALVQSRLSNVAPEILNASGPAVLDAYASSVESLADELELRANLSCVAPEIEAAPADGARTSASTPYIFESIYQAFACDLVSSVTYAIGGETINQISHGHLYDAELHNDAALNSLLMQNLHAASHRTDELGSIVHELARTDQSRQLAGLLDQLASTPDISGGSLLDNTVVFVTSAMSSNTHRREEYPLLLIAGANTRLKGGFHYDCAGSTNNDLLTTIAQGLTLPDTSFGGYKSPEERLPQLNNGPITKLLVD